MYQERLVFLEPLSQISDGVDMDVNGLHCCHNKL